MLGIIIFAFLLGGITSLFVGGYWLYIQLTKLEDKVIQNYKEEQQNIAKKQEENDVHQVIR